MLSESDRAVLNETYCSCTMGTEAIITILNKVYDEELSLDLNRQVCRFTSFGEKVTEKMVQKHERPKADGARKTKLWAGIQMNTLTDTSTEHVAELMVRGNAMAITDLMKAVKRNKDAKKEYCELAEELMDFEEKCIETLKAYLK